MSSVMPNSRSATIKKPTSAYKRPAEHLPDPGQYDSHLTPFGELKQKIDMGSKYKFKPLNDGAGPGAYHNDGSIL